MVRAERERRGRVNNGKAWPLPERVDRVQNPLTPSKSPLAAVPSRGLHLKPDSAGGIYDFERNATVNPDSMVDAPLPSVRGDRRS